MQNSLVKSKSIWLKLLWAIAALSVSATVSALGMGGINVVSALGQPLKADIELVAVGKTDLASMVARLASPETYKNSGLEYPYGNRFIFKFESRANGEPYLALTSVQPINDPFVTVLVEMTWPSGKLLREYTFLLDPPGYVPTQPAQTVVQAVAPAVQIAASEVPAVPTEAEAAIEIPLESPVADVALGEPVMTADPTATSEISPVSEEMAAVSGVVETPEEIAAASAVTEISAAAEPVTMPEPAAVTAGSVTVVPDDKEWLVVERGDTLNEIAKQYKLAHISLERMLVALYRANINEFDARNMNRIKAGKVLRLPKEQDAENVTQAEAKREIRAQAADWNVYRQQLASAAASRKAAREAVQQAASGKISSSVADKAPVVQESAKQVLKLSKGEAPGDQVATGAGGKPLSDQEKRNTEQEDSIASAKAAKEEQMRTAMLEKNLQDMQLLAQLKAEAAAMAQSQIAPASKVVIASPMAAVSPALATSAVEPAPAAQKPKAAPTKEEPSLVDQMLALLDQLLGQPIYLAGGAGALLVLGGLGFMMKRPGGLGAVFARLKFKPRKKKSPSDAVDEADVGEVSEQGVSGDVNASFVSGRMAAPVAPSPDNGDFTRPATKAASVSEADNVDPISEADLFLNFGRDAQAEEILKEALETTPNNYLIHLKLLGIYANRKDANSFSAIALLLKDSGDEHAWQEAVALGRELEPGNPLYGGAGASQQSAVAEAASTKPADKGDFDFDFDLGALSEKSAASPAPEDDFLGVANKTTILSPGDMAAAKQPSTMDFDVTAGSPPASKADESAAPNLADLIFDVTGNDTAKPAQPVASKPEPAKIDDGAMEFTIDFPVAKKPPKPAPPATDEGGLAGISFNLDETPAPSGASAEGKDDHWQEVATKLDLAKAYQEMGDADGVREILAEVLNEGDAEQQETAKAMLKQVG